MSISPELLTSPQPVVERPKIDIPAFMRSFRNATHFREFDEDLVVAEDLLGLERMRPDESIETYSEKMAQDRGRDRDEAASWGIGRLGRRKFVGIIFNWEFMAGTSGAVVGEKIARAAGFAAWNDLPIIMACASGGQRMQEGVSALMDMRKTVYALHQFKKQTRKPVIMVVIGHLWGGLTASAQPMAETVIGLRGSSNGFAGPRVIEDYEMEKPPPESQSVENFFNTNRAVDVIVNDQAELLKYLDEYLKILASADQAPQKPKRYRETAGIDFGHEGYHIPYRPKPLRSHHRIDVPMAARQNSDPRDTWEQYQILISDIRRPDTLYILQHAFDGYLPLFSGRVFDGGDGIKYLRFPAIVSALAYIDDPRLEKRLVRMVIGNQPSYLRLPDKKGRVMINQKSSYPTAWDYRHQLASMRYAARMGWPITTLISLLGARPSLADEEAAQFEAIESCIEFQIEYPYLAHSYLIGLGGSGGALALQFPELAALSGAQEYTAPPGAAAVMLYPNGPTEADKRRTADGMHPETSFLKDLGIVKSLIEEPMGGAQNNPLITARLIREDIILTELEFGGQTSEEIITARGNKIRNSHPIPIKHLNGKPPRFRSRLDRFFHH